MTDIVWGEDVIIQKKLDNVWYTIGCAISVVFEFENELIGKTDVNAGLFKKYRVRISDCRGQVNGVTKISNADSALSIFHFMEEGVRRTEGEYRYIFEDQNGNQQLIQMTALVQAINLTGDMGQWSTFDLSIQGSGGFEMDTIAAPDVPHNEEWFSDFWETSEGLSVVNGNSAIWGYPLLSHTLIAVYREGLQYDIITTGTPGNRECKYNSIAGTIEFQYPFNAGERVWVIYKEIV